MVWRLHVNSTSETTTKRSKPRIPVSPTSVNPLTGSLNVYAQYDPAIREARAPVTEAGKIGTALDSLTLELVRLRNAHLQGCLFCGSFRSRAARQRGMDETMVGDVFGDYEDSPRLTERHKVAMRLVDAFILGFGALPEGLAEQAHQHFSDAELSEIGLKVFLSSTNKTSIALGLDHEDPQERFGLRVLEDYFSER
jgi:AhpD family alkylhydroperoxidase